ncbi:MAG: hypothetical protein IT365_16060, partial [Candidatus Hydrogenedentes bacterium]|nr:hypothetical protein [Candidatus Hydrogenedentota bacterium]
MKTCIRLALLWCLMAGTVAGAVDAGFLERFALADDRAEVLKELVPGTEDYYYFHCLHEQHLGQFAEVDALLKTWIERYGITERAQEVRNRQALLRYSTEPEKTLEYLKGTLGLDFNQQRQIPGEVPDLPTQLDPNTISRDTLLKRTLENPQYADTVQGFTKRAYDWLLAVDLGETRLRALLESLDMPDYPNLPALIAKDLDAPHSSGFGSLPIHTLLVREQLDELLTLKPDLLNQDAFITAYMQRLQPSADQPNWRLDPKLSEAYLGELQAFVSRLSPSQNALRSHVLYHRLEHDRSQGIYDKKRFLEYLK